MGELVLNLLGFIMYNHCFQKSLRQMIILNNMDILQNTSRIIIRLVHLESIVCPAAKLHNAGLLVEGEVLHVHLTGAVVDGWRLPLDETLTVESGLGGQGHLEVPFSTSVKIAGSGD